MTPRAGWTENSLAEWLKQFYWQQEASRNHLGVPQKEQWLSFARALLPVIAAAERSLSLHDGHPPVDEKGCTECGEYVAWGGPSPCICEKCAVDALRTALAGLRDGK